MRMNSDQVIQGIINYADNEVMSKLPTSGKWVMGAAIYLVSNKAHNVVDAITDNAVVKALDVVDEDGQIDTDALLEALRFSADKYGKLTVDVPMIGRLSFSSSDIDALGTYMR